MMLFFEILVLLFAADSLAVGEFPRVLMTVQQNSYRIDRYRRYLSTAGESTSIGRLLAMALFLAVLIPGVPQVAALGALGVFFVWSGTDRLLRRRTYKHPVVFTPRVKRLHGVMCAISLLAACAAFFLAGLSAIAAAEALLLCWILAPAIAIAALTLLQPVENCINRKYINEAADILRSMPDLKVIGITGSYGKTSTKHYLYRILSEQFAVCMTPGSFNTTLGVVRTIREHLKPFDRVFICEMGAKQNGDIKEICDLVHPQIGIITAVGPQHLESFKTIENVQRTKFELIDSLPADGLAVVNDDFEYVANRPVGNVETIRYAVNARPEVQFSVSDIAYSAAGTDFTVHTPQGEELKLHTRLVGECNVSNLLAAVIVALHLGVEPRRIAYAVEQIEQVEHRLNIKRVPGGMTIIDDAFNSNPTGSAMALDVLAAMTGGRRIVITPGMIELGDEQEALNAEFGRKIAGSADVAIIVGRYNRDAIMQGIGDAPECEVHTVDTFAQAQALLHSMARPGDTVLYENDLPDTFK